MIEKNKEYSSAETLYAFDTIEFCDADPDKVIILAGWQMLKSGVDPEFQASIGGKPIEMKLRRFLRADVNERCRAYHTGYQPTDRGGFFAEVELGEALPPDDQKFVFGRIGMEPMVEEPIGNLKSFRPQNSTETVFSVDTVTGDEELYEANGWTYTITRFEGKRDPQLHESTITVTDDSGKELEVQIVHRMRPDVMSGSANKMRYSFPAGYKLTWKGSGSPWYHLHFVLPGQSEARTYDFNAVEYAIGEREKKRKYKNLFEWATHINGSMIRDDRYMTKKYGFHFFLHTVKMRVTTGEPGDYMKWRKPLLPTPEELEEQKKEAFAYSPKISIVVPAYRTPGRFLKEMIRSVQEQSYQNWQLCIADGSGDPRDHHVERILKSFAKKDCRIVCKVLPENLGIAGNTNAAMELADGEFIALLDHDDTLAPEALYEIVKALQNHSERDVIYTDEDKVDRNTTEYYDPYFKSDYNIDMLRNYNYICHFFVVRKSLVDQVGGFRKEFDGAQDFDFVFRCTEKAREIYHMPKCVYHWRVHPGSTAASAASKPYTVAAGKHAIEAHLERCKVKGEVSETRFPNIYHVKYLVTSPDMVSIIIPNKDQKEALERCINSILEKTAYQNYEILIVENNSTEQKTFDYYREIQKNPKVRVITWESKFNYAAINNFGAKAAKGDYFLFLNNDMEVLNSDWLERLLGCCQRSDVGAVGAKLFYPGGNVQHCGVIVGLGGVAAHAFSGINSENVGYFNRAIVQQDLSAVTGACLFVSRKLFEQVGGFTEELEVDFNDLDLCLKIRKAGYLVVLDTTVQLLHYESLSRGDKDTDEKWWRFQNEAYYIRTHWQDILTNGDPYYNPNLTLADTDFGLREDMAKILGRE